MKLILVLISLSFLNLQNAYSAYSEQDLQEVIITDTPTDTLDERNLPPKRKQYPILDEFEKQLYPGRNFHKENPAKRLERIEIAVFGTIQTGGLKSRITALEVELNSWHIAQGKVPGKNSHARNISSVRETMPAQTYSNMQNNYYPAMPLAKPVARPAHKQVDYDYMNYRMFSPLVQVAGRRAISRIFAQ